MYTETEILAKQALARALKLSGAELLDDVAAVQRDCNGIGAAWFPDRLRNLLDGLFPELEIVADIHDRRYSIGGGALSRWKADFEFLCNGLRVALRFVGISIRRRFLLARVSAKMYLLLAIGGAAAFNYKKRG
mgnify:CR=1 FL=1